MCTYMPDIFVTEVDWIGVDPYPFTKSTQLNDTRQRNRLHTAIQNITRYCDNDIFLVGQSASYKGNDPGSMRFPTEGELNYYLEVSQTYDRIKALYWWWYPDIPKADFYGASSKGGEHLLKQQKIIGEKIFSR